MKVRAIRGFVDKDTLKNVEKGDEFDISKKRFEEINSTFYGIFVEKVEKAKQEKDPNEDEKPESVEEADGQDNANVEADPRGGEHPEGEADLDGKDEN